MALEYESILRKHLKVKTTAPKQYCVRPNSGRIDPGANVEVQGGLHERNLLYLNA